MQSPIEQHLRRLHAEIAEIRDGLPYTVGPDGRTIDPDDFGICLATADGYVYEVGTTDKPFSLQSLSKPFSYGLALDAHGKQAVDRRVDVEASGDSFTEISLAPGTGRPANAMINAGALAVAGMIEGADGDAAIDTIVDLYSACAGRPLDSDDDVFAAERAHSDHNHALAFLLSSFGIIESSPTAALETYLRQCAVQVTCRDLSLMAATLANGGTHPRTGAQVLGADAVERVLSVMMTAGMYDNAGDWVTSVGMPAKSGVGGGTLAVLPGQAGLAVFSPPLDRHGTSVRGEEVCRRLSGDMGMHFVRAARVGRSVVRDVVTVEEAPSTVRRTEEALAVLREHGGTAVVIVVGGDLFFAGTESLVREIGHLPDDVATVVLDVRQVDELGGVALGMLRATETELARAGRLLLTIDPDRALGTEVPADPGHRYGSRSAAVARAEDRVLERYAGGVLRPAVVPVQDAPALSSLDPDDVAALVARMEARTYADGDVVRRAGERFGGVHFIVSGRILTTAPSSDGGHVVLSTLSAGNTFGEIALADEDHQETGEDAHGTVEVMVLTDAAIDALEHEDPRLAVALWRALARDAYTLLDQYLREIAVRARD